MFNYNQTADIQTNTLQVTAVSLTCIVLISIFVSPAATPSRSSTQTASCSCELIQLFKVLIWSGCTDTRVWAEFWAVHHMIAAVRPAGVSRQEVWASRKSSVQAQVPARLQPFQHPSSPPLSLLKTHPASLNVSSHHHRAIPDLTLFTRIQAGFCHAASRDAKMLLERNAAREVLITESFFLTSAPPPDLSHRRAAILRHVLPAGQG